MVNVLTVDVEEYFHPTEVQQWSPPRQWPELPSRVVSQTQAVLRILGRNRVQATFFVLGWVAERHPGLVRQIADAGHEIGCHSYAHQLVYDLSPAQFRQDTSRAVDAIAKACGVVPRVYRAPSYSITKRSLWALQILVECGFTHDSSIYPIAHDRYGIPGFSRHAEILQTPSGPIQEIPIAAVALSGGKVAPVGGGAYLRLLPYCYTAAGVRRMNEREGLPACVYFHPWELDGALPRLANGVIARWRTYTGLKKMGAKLHRLLSEFSFSTIGSVYPVPEILEALPKVEQGR